MSRPTIDGLAGAVLSDCGHYRYALWRNWDRDLPPLGWIMLNPSTADARQDDPTIRRCIGFAKRDGYGGIRVANLYSLRATHPKMLGFAREPIGPFNDPDGRGDPWGWLTTCKDVVLAWGNVPRGFTERSRYVLSHAPTPDVRLLCLGTTKSGQPRHPLYMAAETPLAYYRVLEATP